MSKWLVTLLAALGCLALACGFATPEPTREPATPVPTLPPGAIVIDLDIKDFSHQTIEIKTGTVVIWTNQDQPLHTTTHIPVESGVPIAWDSGTMPPKGGYRHYFTEPGVFPYNCLIHPVAMRATITVTE